MALNTGQLEKFRQQLEQLREELGAAEQTGSEAEQTVELDQTRVGRLSRMDALQAQAMSKATGQRRRLMLRAIEAAFQRMDAGEYGECVECADEINPLRLEVDPTIKLCIACAEAAE